MSDAVMPHEFGYVPEEHAPDPLANQGDPVAPGKLAIWLFLATEIMFFIGLLGTYIVLRSGSPALFESHGMMLNKWLAGLNTLVLIFSSLTMALSVDAAQKGDRKRFVACLAITILMAFGFMIIKAIEYTDKFTHHIVPGPNFRWEGLYPKPAEQFYSLYFAMTGLHALHMVIGDRKSVV